MIKDTAYLFENQNTPSLDGWVMIITSINKYYKYGGSNL